MHRIGDVVDQAVDDRAGVLEVPLQHPVGGRVVELAERQRSLGRHRPHRGPGAGADVAGGGERLTVDPGGHADVVA